MAASGPSIQLRARAIEGVLKADFVSSLLLFKFDRAGAPLNARALPVSFIEVGPYVITEFRASRRVRPRHKFLRAGHAVGVELASAVIKDCSFNVEEAWLTIGAVQAVKVAVLDDADELV